ncbi:hypothetical protein [Hymenobacter crusticola]|uniref:Intracellular proteinase inhibitor BsuPI domain-containing protein n=1 Tax=Hymenobacter crusticola TaxID=1770526 RepID=A0A243W7K8_9BACT|nr:hypothetical protein [Hymenobacter crusticola]OUJ71004.1 hypothetical protein BXP70_22810 [Hymenobacter crusticola]
MCLRLLPFLLLLVLSRLVQAQLPKQREPMRVFLQALPQRQSKQNQPDTFVQVHFENTSADPIQLVEILSPESMPVTAFFEVTLTSTATPKSLLNSHTLRKMDFGFTTQYGYLLIPPGQRLTRVLNLSQAFRRSGQELPPGKYRAQGYYVSWAGRNCVKGSFRSNSILLRVPD